MALTRKQIKLLKKNYETSTTVAEGFDSGVSCKHLIASKMATHEKRFDTTTGKIRLPILEEELRFIKALCHGFSSSF